MVATSAPEPSGRRKGLPLPAQGLLPWAGRAAVTGAARALIGWSAIGCPALGECGGLAVRLPQGPGSSRQGNPIARCSSGMGQPAVSSAPGGLALRLSAAVIAAIQQFGKLGIYASEYNGVLYGAADIIPHSCVVAPKTRASWKFWNLVAVLRDRSETQQRIEPPHPSKPQS